MALRLNQLIDRTGGVYSTREVMAIMDKAGSTVRTMVAHRCLIALKRNGVWAFPTGQFNKESIALFFLVQYEGTGRTPLTLLADGFNPDILAAAASSILEHRAR